MPETPPVPGDAAGLRAANARLRELLAERDERLAERDAEIGLLRYPEFAQWCGTELTADWHVRYRVAAVVYGHLHIPRTTGHDGVRFEGVSLGYPREWQAGGRGPGRPRQILPAPGSPG